MIFQLDTFVPESCTDPDVRRVFQHLAENSGSTIELSDILAAVVCNAPPDVMALLCEALPDGFSADDLELHAESISLGHEIVLPTPRKEESFSADARQVLAQFDATSSGPEALLALVGDVFARMGEHERRLWNILDIDFLLMALAALQQDPTSEDAPIRFPAELGSSEDLTYLARNAGPIENPPFTGPIYTQLFDKIARVLHRRGHILLVGERGVGQSAIMAELARRSGSMEFLTTKRIVSIDCRYVAPDESKQRLIDILTFATRVPNLILVIDGFASLLRSDRQPNLAALLSLISRVGYQVIGLIDPHDYAELIADNPDVLEFFSRINLEEPDDESTTQLMQHYARGMSAKFDLEISPDAIDQAVVLTSNYILNERLPTKAVKVLKRACEEASYERGQLGAKRRTITSDDILPIVSDLSSVPVETLRGVASETNYEQGLSQEIFGQEHIIKEVAEELGLIKAGLTDPDKPASVMLFIGQTGTGKTELAKVLARFYSTTKRLSTYTLGNFIEPHSVSGLIGVPAGYVGHDQGGRLINDLRTDPYGVILLDEADKAHPDVMQPCLNLFDEGWIRDQRGQQAFGDRAIFILTANVGQRMISEMVKKGDSIEAITTKMKETIATIRHTKSNRPVFAPELLARIKRILVFKSLDRTAMENIGKKLARDTSTWWQTRRNKQLNIDSDLITYLGWRSDVINGHGTGREGGRIVRKLFSELVESRIQQRASQSPSDYQKCDVINVRSEWSEDETDEKDPTHPGIEIVFD